MKKRFWKGLRAIELVVVLSVIFIILGVVAMRYPDFKCRSMQSEAKFSLQEIYSAQKQFHNEHQFYATLDKLLVQDGRVKVWEKYYKLSDGITPTKDHFSVMAIGIEGSPVAGEIWTVDEFKDIKITKAICRN